jgi:hypothetical protein
MAAKKCQSLVLPGRRVFVVERRSAYFPPRVSVGKVSSMRGDLVKVSLDRDGEGGANWRGPREFKLRSVFRSERSAWESLKRELLEDAASCDARLAELPPAARIVDPEQVRD